MLKAMNFRRIYFALTSLALVCAAAQLTLAQDCPPERILTFGSPGTGAGNFDVPASAIADKQGNIYVSDFNNNRIQKFDRDGKFLISWGRKGTRTGQFSGPDFLAFDADGNILVTDYWNCRVQKFTADGRFLLAFGSEGSDVGQFFGPAGIAVDANGNIYVCDSGNDRIQKFTSTGNPILAWGGVHGSGPGEFRYATDLKINSKGMVFVLDATDYDDIPNDRVQIFDALGNFLSTWGIHGSSKGKLNNPIGLAIDAQDRVYIADTFNNRIQLFDSKGVLILSRGVLGTAPGDFDTPISVSLDSSGNVIVTEQLNNRVQVIRGFASPCVTRCDSGVCYKDSQWWATTIQNNPGQFTNTFLTVPGENFGQPVRVVWNSGFGLQPSIAILSKLSDGTGKKSVTDQLIGKYLAAQLSLRQDLPFAYSRLSSQILACQLATTMPAIGLPPPPSLFVTLRSGVSLTQSSNLQDLFDATERALKTNSLDDQATLIEVYKQFRTCLF